MGRSKLVCACVFVAAWLSLSSHAADARAALQKARRAALELNVFGPTRPLNETAWIVDRVGQNRRFELAFSPRLALLERYLEPGRNHTPEWRSFWQGRFGGDNLHLCSKLTWFGADSSGAAEFDEARAAFSLELHAPDLPAFDFSRADVLPDWALRVEAPEPGFGSVAQRSFCPSWQRPHAVSVVRFDGAEWAHIPLLDCQGAIAPDALDQLSALARPPATPKPELPLPIEPDHDALAGEWLPRIKLLEPRLIWAMQQIASAFPGRSIFIMSGYRRDAHGSYHQQGRALDLYLTGVDNADLFRVCRSLTDVGCGFYPNNKFVHVDVRPFGTHRVAWVDVSGPGEPSRYVTSWPGVLAAPSELSASEASE